MVKHARKHAASKSYFGIFGTAIAGTWLASQLDVKISFFVDEDLYKVGKKHLGRNILQPSCVPQNSLVYLALPSTIAKQTQQRLQKTYPSVKFILPPRF